jgi:hypothetical protein
MGVPDYSTYATYATSPTSLTLTKKCETPSFPYEIGRERDRERGMGGWGVLAIQLLAGASPAADRVMCIGFLFKTSSSS